MKTAEIRTRFLEFFAKKQHAIVPSSSLVPHGDPTLMFTNAGMVQFKHVFLGNEQRDYKRACSSQKCVRAGGKHNDLENVGRTARHHTFFEMLGNFSFGDYFKRDAIFFAWEFLTTELGLPAEKLFVTVFEDDEEAANLWLNDIGISPSALARIGAKDNFWQMGDTGPCGPCTEIFYDHGADIAGGPPGTPEEDGDRFIEIWNLVFMQFDRDSDGVLHPLPSPCVDTGMGLERIAAVMQGVHNNYDIDLFAGLLEAAGQITHKTYNREISDNAVNVSLRVIADHVRSVGFLLADGVLPSNEGSGFVLRRILRRAVRHGRLLGRQTPFLYRMLAPLIEAMGDHYQELRAQQTNMETIVRIEEERFLRTLDKGLYLLDQALAEIGDAGTLSGETLFTLYDTYGFPLDLTEDIVRGSGVKLDQTGFDNCMQAQRQRARAAWSGSGAESLPTAIFAVREQYGATEFLGYNTNTAEAVICGLLLAGNAAQDNLKVGQKGWVIANQTPFYGESGGQVGDAGEIALNDGIGVFRVDDTKKVLPDVFAHIGEVITGNIEVGKSISLTVSKQRRAAIARNHTATHVLQAALQRVLGEHVKQAGSLVRPDKLRFDFNHFTAVSAEQLTEIAAQVNAEIFANAAVSTKLMSQDDAISSGAMALFGEKYGDEVRVVQAGSSTELCGGTHVERLGDIGLLRLLSEGGVAAGIRRIEAVTGSAAYALFCQDSQTLRSAATTLKTSISQVPERIMQLQKDSQQLQGVVAELRAKQTGSLLDDLLLQVQNVGEVKLLAARLPAMQKSGDLRDLLDKCRQKIGDKAVVVLAAGDTEISKVQIIAGVAKSLSKKIHAGKLINKVAILVGGKGGGRSDMAQAGGNKPEQLNEAIKQVAEIVRSNEK
ncbi:MAG: alanine--tRNA ligase [Mariprofundales bacterium]